MSTESPSPSNLLTNQTRRPGCAQRSSTKMIALQRSTRDSACLIFPILVASTAALTYISLAAHGLAPIWGAIFSDAYWPTAIIAVLLWLLLFRYTYRLVDPVAFRTEVFADRIVFSHSSKPNERRTLNRSDIRRFYIKPHRWWDNDHATYPVVYETVWNQTQAISLNYIYDGTARDFLQAVREEWGQDYIPAPKRPGLLSQKIRLWPRGTVDEPRGGPESPSAVSPMDDLSQQPRSSPTFPD